MYAPDVLTSGLVQMCDIFEFNMADTDMQILRNVYMLFQYVYWMLTWAPF